MDWESGFGAVGHGIVQEVEDEFGTDKVMALAASSLVQPLDKVKERGGEREGGTERRGGERGMEVRGIRRWDKEGGTKRETDFDLFPYLAGPVSDVQLLDCSPEQCSNPGWPLHPLFQPLSPLPPPKPMQHS